MAGDRLTGTVSLREAVVSFAWTIIICRAATASFWDMMGLAQDITPME